MNKTRNQQLVREITDFCKKRLKVRSANTRSRKSLLLNIVTALLTIPLATSPDGGDKEKYW